MFEQCLLVTGNRTQTYWVFCDLSRCQTSPVSDIEQMEAGTKESEVFCSDI